MAKAKETKSPAKTVKSAGERTPGSRPASQPASRPASQPTANRRPAKTAPDAPSSDVIQTRTPARGNGSMGAEMSPEEVYRLIQETAYYKAKARGFAPGHEVQDWIEAEAEVRTRLDNRA